MEAAAPVYTQRRARGSPLRALVSEHGEAVERAWGERFEERYGPWRGHWRRALDGFLACGGLACGFARVAITIVDNENANGISYALRRIRMGSLAPRRIRLIVHIFPRQTRLLPTPSGFARTVVLRTRRLGVALKRFRPHCRRRHTQQETGQKMWRIHNGKAINCIVRHRRIDVD